MAFALHLLGNTVVTTVMMTVVTTMRAVEVPVIFAAFPSRKKGVPSLERIAKAAASLRSVGDGSDAIRTLVPHWNNVAKELRYRGAESGLARAYELCAQELEAALADQ